MKLLWKCIGTALYMLFLYGCGGDPPELQFLEYMKEVEKMYDQQSDLQTALEAAETEESKMYDSMIRQTSHVDGGALYVKLMENHLSRGELIKREKEIIGKIEMNISKSERIIYRMKEKKMQDKAVICLDFIKEKNELNNKVIEQYEIGLSNDRELYALLNSENSTIAVLEEVMEEVNESYQSIIMTQIKFNRRALGWNKVMTEYQQAMKST